jgi:pilus assembly protein CpaE
MLKIRLLIASENAEYREELVEYFNEESDFQIIGEALNYDHAIKKAEHLIPNIIIMDVSKAIEDGIKAVQKITLARPNIGVIIITPNPDSINLKQAMQAGAGDVLYKNELSPGDVVQAAQRLHQSQKVRESYYENIKAEDKDRPPQVVTIIGAKGGSGKTTLAVNLAAAIARETKRKVVIVDLNLQFGDVASYLNVHPRRTIAEFVQERNKWDAQLLNSYLIPHDSGVKLLAAPLRVEDAELVTPEQVEKIVMILRQSFDYIIIDSPSYFSDTLITALDTAIQIILIMSLEMQAVKNAKLSLNLLDTLHHSGKTKLIINRNAKLFGINVRDVEKTLDFMVADVIPNDWNTVVNATNKGIPFVISHPKELVSKAVTKVARLIIEDQGYQNDLRTGKEKTTASVQIMKKLFNR